MRKYVWHSFSHNVSSCILTVSKITGFFFNWKWLEILFSRFSLGLEEGLVEIVYASINAFWGAVEGCEKKKFILTFSLVQHWNRNCIIHVNEFYQLVQGKFPSFWLRYPRMVLWPLTYLFIYYQQFIVSLSIFCYKYFLVLVVRNRFYLRTCAI